MCLSIKDFESDIVGKTMIYTRKRCLLGETSPKEVTILDTDNTRDYIKVLLKGEFGRDLSFIGWIATKKLNVISIR